MRALLVSKPLPINEKQGQLARNPQKTRDKPSTLPTTPNNKHKKISRKNVIKGKQRRSINKNNKGQGL